MEDIKKLYPPTADGLMAVLRRLRAPGGCPWDRKQTRETLARCLAEECAELLDAIDRHQVDEICGELGDLLMNALFQAEVAEENHEFTLTDVWQQVIDKMIRRHVHIFGGASASTPEEVLTLWQQVKDKERQAAGEEEPASLLDKVPHELSALSRADKLQSKAAKINFDWPDATGAWSKLQEEFAELSSAVKSGNDERIDEELGDLLFSVVNFARKRQRANAEELLRQCMLKFTRRFKYVEKSLRDSQYTPENVSLETLDNWWNEAKAQEKFLSDNTGNNKLNK